MAKIQCKMCGGLNDLPDGATSGECPYCGSLTTFPKIGDTQMEQIYSRAEHFRRSGNFDKAVSTYESILNRNAEDPEAYWGLLISRYGIEYVEDPATHERIPTCHRVQFDSILADSDYLNALKYASPAEQTIYEKEANRIAEIQKAILKISAQEKPYDVFICYKETTDGGTRTKDSTLAQDIYYQLTKQGMKVFFARITLEDKLGRQYEPYIFAALNSAKVMLVIGTKKEYFEAVWVKNEWSRFLALMKKDSSKLLIPCFKDMDAYDVPEELSMFQCEDMGKIGFMQDILHGIAKVVNAGKTEEKNAAASGSSSPSGAIETAKIIKLIAILLDQQDWDKAGSYCEKLLESDPENPELYLLRCMIARQIPNETELRNCNQDLSVDKNFQTAMRLALPERKKQLDAIGRDAMVNFLLMKCMQNKRVSDLSQLSRCNAPLCEDQDFKAALQTASPERRNELMQIQYAQADFFLDGIRQRFGVASFEQAPVPLGTDAQFQAALKLASPERQDELKDIQRKQFEHFLGKCMESRRVFNEADLAQTELPLPESQDFMTALLCAPPERQAELTKLMSDQVDFFLRKCMEQCKVSSEQELPFSETPLNGDRFFMLAFKYGSPGRRGQLKQFQAAQSDNFLRKCMEEHRVSRPSDLSSLDKPLREDANFRSALVSAGPAQKKQLEQIAAKQQMRFVARKARRLVAILIVVAVVCILGAVIWFNRLQIAATLGGAEMQYNLACRYDKGTGGKRRDYAKAFKWYRKAADRDLAAAQFVVGWFFQYGKGVEIDEAEAEKWFRQAIGGLRKAALEGRPREQNALAICYLNGLGVEKDQKEAVKWYRMAADQGYAAAENNLGHCYMEGEGVEKDEDAAIMWYLKAAKHGRSEAQQDLGYCYLEGVGVEKDQKEAVKWYRKAAKQGLPEAQNSLGYCYSEGVGVEKDQKEAVKWFRKAAKQGQPMAQCNLGRCYMNGIGVEKDEEEAAKWLRKAADQGFAEAINDLEELEEAKKNGAGGESR